MAGASDDYSRVCELEAELVRARASLLVIARSLGELADKYATQEARERGISENDVNMVYGASNLVEQVAAECFRAYKGEE